jgi:hypothetical protein
MDEDIVLSVDADSLYMLITGEHNLVKELTDCFNNNSTLNFTYILCKLSYPLGFLLNDLNEKRNDDNKIYADDGIESSQTLICGDSGINDNEFLIACINEEKNLLTLPKIEIQVNIDTDNQVLMWIRKHSNNRLAKLVENNMKSFSIVGKESNNLLYTSRVIEKNRSNDGLGSSA